MQVREGLEQQIDAVPSLEGAHKANHELAVEVEAPAYRLRVQIDLEQASIDGIGQDANQLWPYACLLRPGAERIRHREQQIGPAPDPALHPAGQGRTGQARAVSLLFVSEGRVDFEQERDAKLFRQP